MTRGFEIVGGVALAMLAQALGSPARLWGEERPLTLEVAIALADQAAVGRLVGLEAERARAEARGAGLWPNPEVSLSREDAAGTVDRFATLSLDLPLWGRLPLERAAARAGVEAAQGRGRQARADLRARVSVTFIELVEAQARVAALQAGRGELLTLLQALRDREREGESSGYDVLRAERELADVEAESGEAQARRGRARAVLAALVNVPSKSLIAEGDLRARGALPGLAEAQAGALSRGDVRALDADQVRSEKLVAAAGRRVVPEPSVTAGLKTTEVGGRSDTGYVVGLSLALPFFDRSQGARAVAQIERRVVEVRREVGRREAEAEVEAAHAEAVARRGTEDSVRAAGDPDELARIARGAYELGEVRILDLLDAYRSALSFRLRLLALRGEARRAEVALARAMGTDMVP